MVIRVMTAAALLGLGACNWTTFDDLQDGVWVDRVVKPNSSRQYGEAIVAGPTPNDGGGANLTVLGRSSATLSTIAYDETGGRVISTITDFGDPLGFALFPENPPLVAEPADEDGGNRFLFPVITGLNEEGEGRVIAMSARPLGANVSKVTFKDEATSNERILGLNVGALENVPIPVFPGSTPDQLVNDPLELDLVVGRGPQINMVVDYTVHNYDDVTDVPERIWGCNHGRELAYRLVVADVIDDADPLTLDDNGPEIVIGVGTPEDTQSELRIYSPSALRGPGGDSTEAAPQSCVDPLIPAHAADLADLGAAMVATKFDPAAVLSDVVYSSPSGNAVFVRLGDSGEQIDLRISNTGSMFGHALAAGNLDDDPQPELVVGAPRSNVEGATDAGQIYVYDYDPATRTFSDPPLAYATSSPTASERFGKSLAIVPWDAERNVLVVGAEGKVFTYFRTGFYDDVRLGR